MITANSTLAVHAGEEQSSFAPGGIAERAAHWSAVGAGIQAERDAGRTQYCFTNFPEYEAKSVAELVEGNFRAGFVMRPGDAVFVAEIRRHVLTEADCKSVAAPAEIGGAA